MIDIHCHLLPGVDDGAQDMEMTLALIDQGLEQDVDEYVLTPHVLDDFSKEIDDRHLAVFDEMMEEITKRELPVTFHIASEIMFQFEVATIQTMTTSTFGNNGVYFLIEFPFAFFPEKAEEVLFNFQMAGMRPIVAHPERNGGLATEISKIYSMASRGILFQINARSLVGAGGPQAKRVAKQMIADGVANFVSSDAHDTVNRPQCLKETYKQICEFTDEETARRLTIDNPRKAIAGERIVAVQKEYDPLESLWQRLRRKVWK
ncbi:MAG: hypothetical protein QGH20_01215 [Candidatus Latescibacteria bacterium]|nr:hypothetical protein [Candidatus Latescibacterota bacterium]